MRQTVKLKENEAVLLTDAAQRRYVTGFESSFGYLVITAEKTAFFTDKRYLYAAKNKLEAQGVVTEQFTGLDGVKAFLDAQGVRKLFIDYSLVTLDEFAKLKTLGVKFKDACEKLNSAFAVKTKEEIESIKKACKIAETAFYGVLPLVKKGITEKQLANELEYKMLLLGAEKVSFDTIVAFGANTAVPHHETGDTSLKENTPVLIDFGCKVNGYCSDCTRTFFYGNADDEFRRAYNAVLEANVVAEETVKTGFTGAEADAIARDILGKYGMADAFTHSLGHGIGINIHEYPYLSPKGGDKLLNGMVFSDEPGVYFEGKFGIRIEDTVTLAGGKVKRLFTGDKNLIEINI